ncbi:hypothetical protein BC936DRAFT_149553 [Jimgerdemannia flammicorona]|uniref:Uncharacterized protein n=1 Tax=Jimgerdemannia flammicorona TaxID=994334 RepID=A0A433D0L5_9FUNG|nr:hypothetical protein BC936DRAFT_149553 [Jimgerdemannia flammicorona]
MAIFISEEKLGMKCPATFLNNLTLLYASQSEYDKAGPLYERALAVSEKVFPLSLNNLAGVYYSQGKTRAPRHGIISENPGWPLQHPGKYDKAEPLYE